MQVGFVSWNHEFVIPRIFNFSAFLSYFAETQRTGVLEMRANLRVVTPATLREMQKVTGRSRNPAGRKTDEAYGREERKYLQPAEVEALIKVSRAGRNGRRDALMIALAYHHALRATELIELEWDQIDLKDGTIKLRRKKNGVGGPQHLDKQDLYALRALRRENDDRFVFVSRRNDGWQRLTRDAFAKILATAGDRAGLDRRLCHPHALRHAAGHALANSGKVNAYQLQAVMGHRDARSTSIYVQGVAGLIKGLWN
jgi:integrase